MTSLLLLLVLFTILYILYANNIYYIVIYTTNYKLLIGITFTMCLLYSKYLGRNFINIECDRKEYRLGV